MAQLSQPLLKHDQHRVTLHNKNESNKSSSIKKLSMHSGIKIQRRKTIKINKPENQEIVIFASFVQGNSIYFNNNSIQVQSMSPIKLDPKKSFQGSYEQFYSIPPQSQIQRFSKQGSQKRLKLQQIKENIQAEHKITEKESILPEDKTQGIVSKIDSVQISRNNRSSLIKRKTNRIKIQLKKKQEQISFKEQFYNFFGQGVNNNILYLSNYVTNLLLLNIFFDILFRIYLFWICLQCYFLSNYKTYYFYPILAELVARFITFLTLIKMSFDEKYEVSVTFQKAISDKQFVDVEFDKIFRRQYSYKNARSIIMKCMIPPQLLILVIEASQFTWKKIFILVNLIFKSFENILVLMTFGLILKQTQYRLTQQIPFYLLEVAAIVILEQIARYTLSYLLIYFISRKK